MITPTDIEKQVREYFLEGGIRPVEIKIRRFPGETIVIVEVASQFQRATELGNSIDSEIEDGFVTVRLIKPPEKSETPPVRSVRDERVTRLVSLLDERSRTSEAQPSLRYVEDVEGRLQVATSERHHLIFGRRGAGKSALMLQAKSQLERAGVQTLWVNIQTLRKLGSDGAFLAIAKRFCELPESYFGSNSSAKSLKTASSLLTEIETLSRKKHPGSEDIERIIPSVNRMLAQFCVETQVPIYLFLDDIHYLTYHSVPDLLDRLHGLSREVPVWLKIAGIRHQMRWFRPEPPTGLQLQHDAIEINLDITLQEPERAKQFLQSVLDGFIEECDATPRRGFLHGRAVDRLVLASGGVPRDFVTLVASAIQVARGRENARMTGVQDVNEAAGKAAKAKMQELEEDAAAALGSAESVLGTLNLVRKFCIDGKGISFFRIDFLDKERRPREYSLIQRLMDLRIIHLINSSLSDGHLAGRRYEAYLLDLSEYTAARLKQRLWVLDFERGHIALKKTRSKEPVRIGDTARKLVGILRRGPVLPLSMLEELANPEDTA